MPPDKKRKIASDSSLGSVTSDLSITSSTGSNNFTTCLAAYLEQDMASRITWTDTMDEEFITGYIYFKEEKLWDNKKPLDTNFANLAAHFVENGIMNVTGGQLNSRFYHIKKKWDLFSNLRKNETGMGWDDEAMHFTASEEHWASLEEKNKGYVDFRKPHSCYMYNRLSAVLIGNRATGSRAQSASQTVPPDQPRRPRASTHRNRKGKVAASTSSLGTPTEAVLEPDEEYVYYVPPVPGAVGGKRPASSFGTSGEIEGTRGTKSTRGSASALEDALSRIANFSDVALEGHRQSIEADSTYSAGVSQDIIKEMNIPRQWKTIATRHYANQEQERFCFIRASPDERYDFIVDLMKDKGLA